ncbi:hypothetical protein H0W91_00250 [Patescibacteria group bacterium]|nr:hypothetical protein [Patescibacteria group bacterium]
MEIRTVPVYCRGCGKKCGKTSTKTEQQFFGLRVCGACSRVELLRSPNLTADVLPYSSLKEYGFLVRRRILHSLERQVNELVDYQSYPTPSDYETPYRSKTEDDGA